MKAKLDRFWFVLLVLPPLLIFPNLGGTFLWQDEAETALLARSILSHGVPLAHDGRRAISDQPGAPDVSEEGLWIWTPWLQHYVAAASFAVLGDSNFAARAPFALAGWGVILLSYALFRRLTRRVFTARLAVLLLATSVPFLLQVRQSRYYAFLALFVLCHLWGYLRMARAGRGGGALFLVGGVGLYFTLMPQLAASTLAAGIDAAWVRRDRRLVWRVVSYSALVAILCLPFFVYTQAWSRDYLGLGHGFDSLQRYGGTLRTYLVAVHLYAWPFVWGVVALWLSRSRGDATIGRAWAGLSSLAAVVWLWTVVAPPSTVTLAVLVFLFLLVAAAIVAWIVSGERGSGETPWLAHGATAITLTLVISIALYSALSPTAAFRYLTGLLPLFALATASLLETLAGKRRSVLVVLVLVLCTTDAIQRLPFWLANPLWAPATPSLDTSTAVAQRGNNLAAFVMLRQDRNTFPHRYWLPEYVGELLGDYDGPVEAALRHLWEHAEPEDVILVRYEHFPIMYYTDLTVVRWDEAPSLEALPDWIFVHGFAKGRLPRHIVSSFDRYERVPLDAREFVWENIPEPYLHLFRTRTDGPRLRLYRLAKPEPPVGDP